MKFFDRIQKLDDAVAGGAGGCDYGRDIRPLLLELPSVRYFYALIKDPSWLPVLDGGGCFSELPTDIAAFMPSSPEALGALEAIRLALLAELAVHAPVDVLGILGRIHVPNGHAARRYYIRILVALAEVNALALHALVASEVEWLAAQSRIDPILTQQYRELVSAIAMRSPTDAKALAGVLLEPLPEAEGAALQQHNLGFRLEFWDYAEMLTAASSVLTATDSLGALEWVVALATGVFQRLSGSTEETDGRILIWRPSIEDSEQNVINDVLNCLIVAARDTAEALAPHHGQSVLDALEDSGFLTFHRIAIHLRGSHPELDPEGTEMRITDPVLLMSSVLRHEVFHALEERFASFSVETQDRYLRYVDALGDEKKRRLFLWPIRAHLDDTCAADFRRLEETFGVLEHPDYLAFHTAEWVGPTSPYSTDDMLQMSSEELVEVLNNWEFRGGVDVPEPEGLARELANMVTKDPARISREAEAFEKLTRATYVRGIVQGLAAAAKTEDVITWGPVINLCRWAVDQPRGDGPEGTGLEEFDRTWGPARKQIAWLLERGSQRSAAEIPYELRSRVWPILERLVEDPDPTPEEEVERAKYEDPSTTAINTVRGVALGAVFSYARWVTRHDTYAAKSWSGRGLEDVRLVIERRLRDPSPAVHSVLGRCLPLLYSLDGEWTRASIPEILPLDKSSEKLWGATWQAYLMFTRTLYTEFLALLRASYDRALEGLGSANLAATQPANPDERFGGHLVLFYREQALSREDPLFAGFFEKASPDLRFSVMSDAARAARSIPDNKRKVALALLQELWEWRREAVIDARDLRELSSFSWWFLEDGFPAEWRLSELERSQNVSAKLELDGPVLEKLAELCASHLPEVLACLDAIVRNPANEHWGLYDDHAKVILRKALTASDAALRARSEDLVHYIGSLGFLDFREVLRTPKSAAPDLGGSLQ
jgi:hypothetical protein